ncbi:MAG TPA: cytosine permease [Kineosporiaceae bacterium]
MASTPDVDGALLDGALRVTAEVREGEYGAKVAAVEPGGAEFIPLVERHGTPLNLLWTWTSPNLEFATVFLGVLAVAAFGQSFPAAVVAIVLGTAAGSVSHGVLSARGPELGVAQMIVGRVPFGFSGNALPAGLNAVVAGIGWFAVNSVSGAFALNALFGVPKLGSLVIVVVAQVTIAFLGHNFIHSFERWVFPLLGIVFVVACLTIAARSHPGALTANPTSNPVGAFLLTVGTSFGYAAGWNPYAADYTRYLAPEVSKKLTGRYAGLGVFVSCTVLEIAGALSVSLSDDPVGQPTAAFTSSLPGWLAKLTLFAIAIGAISANAINVYSGAMSFLALGIRIPLRLARAIVAAAFSVLGFGLAWNGLSDAGHKYEAFLLVIAYWVGPWLAVMFVDQWLRRGHRVDGFLFDRSHNPFAGWVAMLVGMVVSIWLFSHQEDYVGPIAKGNPAWGDVTFEIGFVIAAVLYIVLFRLQRDRTDEVLVVPGRR